MSLISEVVGKTQSVGALFGSAAGGATSGAMAQVLASLLQQQGGLVGLVEKLGQSGLGPQVRSWVSNSQNMPVTGAEVTQALGSGPVAQIGQQLGVDPQQAGGLLANILPHLVDHLTPGGQLPAQGAAQPIGVASISSALTTIVSKLEGR